jgi:hypothetical protein
MATVDEVRLREAEHRARVLENAISAASVMNEAGVSAHAPEAHAIFHQLVKLPDERSMRVALREAASAPIEDGDMEQTTCPTCEGTGMDGSERCSTCRGSGLVSQKQEQADLPLQPAGSATVLRAAAAPYTAAAREHLAKEGTARPDGSYPIRNRRDVEKAVADFGRSSDATDADKAHIVKRAKEVDALDALPEDRRTHLQESQRLREAGVPTLDGPLQRACARAKTCPGRVSRSSGIQRQGRHSRVRVPGSPPRASRCCPRRPVQSTVASHDGPVRRHGTD